MHPSATLFVFPCFIFFIFIAYTPLYFLFDLYSVELVVLLWGMLALCRVATDVLLVQDELAISIAHQTTVAGVLYSVWLAYGLMWDGNTRVVRLRRSFHIAAQVSHVVIALLYAYYRRELKNAKTAVGRGPLYSGLRVVLVCATTFLVVLVPVNIAHTMGMHVVLGQASAFLTIWYSEMIMGGVANAGITTEYLVFISITSLRLESIPLVLYTAWFVSQRLIVFIHHFAYQEKIPEMATAIRAERIATVIQAEETPPIVVVEEEKAPLPEPDPTPPPEPSPSPPKQRRRPSSKLDRGAVNVLREKQMRIMQGRGGGPPDTPSPPPAAACCCNGE